MAKHTRMPKDILVILYIDDSTESVEAEKLLKEAGIPFEIVRDVPPRADEDYPTVISSDYMPLRGLEGVKTLIDGRKFAQSKPWL